MRRLRFLAIGSLFVGCSLMTRFDPDAQPCDKNEPSLALSCLSDAGYFCVDGFCKLGTAPGADGGADAGPDGGGKDGGNLGG